LRKTEINVSIDMSELKKRAGIRHYNSKWHQSLKELAKIGLVKVSTSQNGSIPEDGPRKFFYYATPKGKQIIDGSEIVAYQIDE